MSERNVSANQEGRLTPERTRRIISPERILILSDTCNPKRTERLWCPEQGDLIQGN
jgi:hypothetical protein